MGTGRLWNVKLAANERPSIHVATYIEVRLYIIRIIPHSGYISREKMFENFADMLLCTKTSMPAVHENFMHKINLLYSIIRTVVCSPSVMPLCYSIHNTTH